MAKHELHCTMNPRRVCRVCPHISGGVQVVRSIPELIAKTLPIHPREYYEGMKEDEVGMPVPKNPLAQAEIDQALPQLREAVSNCPVCIMAALRQANIPVWMATGFDFKAELKALWDEVNNEKVMSCNGGY